MSTPTSGPQEVAIPSAISAGYPEIRNWLRKLDLEATTEAEENNDVVLQIMQGILSASNEEELFAAQNAGIISAKEFVNMPFRVTSENVSWRKSAIEGSVLPYYTVLKLTDLSDGTQKVVGCGGPTFMTVLSKLIDFGALDREQDNGEGRPLQIISKRTGRGFDVLMLAPFNISGSTSTKTKNGSKS